MHESNSVAFVRKRYVTRPTKTMYLRDFRALCVLFFWSTHLIGINGDFTYTDLFEAQFVNVFKEQEVSEMYSNSKFNWVVDRLQDWYNISMSKNATRVKRNWKDLTQASELQSDTLEHSFDEVTLSFSFPFYGREVNSVIVSTGGALLLGSVKDEFPIPSYIAPFLSSLPPGDDDIIFSDSGNRFTVQWTKHYLNDDHYKQKIQLSIYKDGSMTFLYQNLLPQLLEKAKDTGYPVLIGLEEGFTASTEGDVKTIYLYRTTQLVPESLVSNYTMLTFTPLVSGCHNLKDQEPICSKADHCSWCPGKQKCMHEMEVYRPSNRCDRDTTMNKVCDFKCDLNYDPVCGSDGFTYSNPCELRSISCTTGQNVAVASTGACPSIEEQKNGGKNGDECNLACPKIRKPVCGTNGITYSNECVLKSSNCNRDGDPIILQHEGICDDDRDYDYDSPDNEGDEDESDDGEEVLTPGGEETGDEDKCTQKCDKQLDVVCVNGNIQLSNKCVMEFMACTENVAIADWKPGPCGSDDDEEAVIKKDRTNNVDRMSNKGEGVYSCPVKGCSRVVDPVCGSDGNTYSNECILRQISCELPDGALDMARRGRCENDQICPPVVCSREMVPVCASDGRTYANKCLFDAAAACKGEEEPLRMEKEGRCDGDDEQGDNDSIHRKGKGAEDRAGEDEEESKSHKLSRALKGAIFLATAIAIALMSVALFNVYQRSHSIQHQAAPPPHLDLSLPPTPVSQTELPNVMTQPQNNNTVSGSVELSIIRGNRPSGYDRLPLVPNMEDEQGGVR